MRNIGTLHVEFLILRQAGGFDFHAHALKGLCQFEADFGEALRVGFDLGGVLGDDDVATDQLYVDLRCQVSQGITDRGWSGSGDGFALE